MRTRRAITLVYNILCAKAVQYLDYDLPVYLKLNPVLVKYPSVLNRNAIRLSRTTLRLDSLNVDGILDPLLQYFLPWIFRKFRSLVQSFDTRSSKRQSSNKRWRQRSFQNRALNSTQCSEKVHIYRMYCLYCLISRLEVHFYDWLPLLKKYLLMICP